MPARILFTMLFIGFIFMMFLKLNNYLSNLSKEKKQKERDFEQKCRRIEEEHKIALAQAEKQEHEHEEEMIELYGSDEDKAALIKKREDTASAEAKKIADAKAVEDERIINLEMETKLRAVYVSGHTTSHKMVHTSTSSPRKRVKEKVISSDGIFTDDGVTKRTINSKGIRTDTADEITIMDSSGIRVIRK